MALGLAAGADAEPAAPAPAPACQAEDEGARIEATAALLDAIRRREARRAERAVVVETLDNRGYNYGPAPDPLADLPQREPR